MYLSHHGILGQKWGKRNGPPYPLRGGDYSREETAAIYSNRKMSPHSIYNKKHFDEVLKSNKTKLTTLSYDPNRTKNTDMFYAAHKFLDNNQYNALFNKKAKDVTGDGYCLKFKIQNKLKKDMKVASEDSGAEVFRDLYSKDRDFYNFVTDKDRLRGAFDTSRYRFKGYQEARDTLSKMDSPDYKPSSQDLQKVYRMFNYVIPSDGHGNAKLGQDVLNQRTKFFNECKKEGYGAVLDTNDAIYGGFKATSPVIVFDMKNVVPDSISRTRMRDKAFSKAVFAGRKVCGL